jgi:NAD(P)-dependent dehydrogenase (short-subunit alcohol dehydrogenase family)
MPNPSTNSMAGRTVLVTGGTSGMGRATATGLAEMGALTQQPARLSWFRSGRPRPAQRHRRGDNGHPLERLG